jgi:hypothetical protein
VFLDPQRRKLSCIESISAAYCHAPVLGLYHTTACHIVIVSIDAPLRARQAGNLDQQVPNMQQTIELFELLDLIPEGSPTPHAAPHALLPRMRQCRVAQGGV